MADLAATILAATTKVLRCRVSETRGKQEIGVGKEALIANRSITSIDGPYSRLLLLNFQSISNQFLII
jgi:hypothetical protein